MGVEAVIWMEQVGGTLWMDKDQSQILAMTLEFEVPWVFLWNVALWMPCPENFPQFTCPWGIPYRVFLYILVWGRKEKTAKSIHHIHSEAEISTVAKEPCGFQKGCQGNLLLQGLHQEEEEPSLAVQCVTRSDGHRDWLFLIRWTMGQSSLEEETTWVN